MIRNSRIMSSGAEASSREAPGDRLGSVSPSPFELSYRALALLIRKRYIPERDGENGKCDAVKHQIDREQQPDEPAAVERPAR